MQLLPKWALANPFPAIHDFESLTVIDQTARIYGAMNDLIKYYNQFADGINDIISEFTESEVKNREEFELNVTKVMQEFICGMERKYADLEAVSQKILNEAIAAGTITVTERYDPVTESLEMVLGGEV